MGSMIPNMTLVEIVKWEDLLSRHLCTAKNKYEFLVRLGFVWSEVKSLKLNDSPLEMAREIMLYLISDLNVDKRKFVMSKLEDWALPEWIKIA